MSREEDFEVTGRELVANRYLMLERIASGSMGEVWRGEDTRLNRPVAIKLLHPSLSEDGQFRERFAFEATLVARLKGQHLATVYDYGEERANGTITSYLIMELVDGRPLTAILDERGRLPVPETIRIIGDAAEGLHAAHQAGIVHRDVKPGNILITPDGSVKLIDFGIAHIRGRSTLTESGSFMGTLAYVCPDQIANEEPTSSTDIYSLGIVAYECLTGEPPFGSDIPAAVLNSHLYEPPPPLPDHVPEQVSHAILMALRKRPEHRWQTIDAFAHAIRNPCDDTDPDPVSAVVTAEPERVAKVRAPGRWRRLQWLVQASMAVAIVLLAILVWHLPWHVHGASGHDGNSNGGQRLPDVTAEGGQSGGDSGSESGSGGTRTPDDGTKSKKSGGKEDPETVDDPDTPTPVGDGDETAAVPKLRGESPNEVPTILQQHGFHSSSPVRTDPVDGKKSCVVYKQSPRPRTIASTDTTVTYYYRADESGCEDGETNSDGAAPTGSRSSGWLVGTGGTTVAPRRSPAQPRCG